MADINIKAGITVDTGDAEAGLKDVQTQLEKTGKAVQTVDNNTAGATGKFNKLKEGLTDMSPALGGVQDGIGKVSSAFKILLANPVVLVITAIVAALAALYKAFTSTADGADKVGFVFEGLKSIVTTVYNTILEVGSAIVKFFSGDFKGALAQGSKAVLGFGRDAKEGFDRAYNAAKQLDDIEDSMKALSVERAKQNAQLKASKEALNDENVSLSEKKKILESVSKTESLTSEKELQLAAAKVEAIKKRDEVQIKSGRQSQKQIDELQEAEIGLYSKQEELTGKKIAIQRQYSSFNKQLNAEAKAASEAALQSQYDKDVARLAALKEQFDKEYQLEVAHQLKRKQLQGMTAGQMAEEERKFNEADQKRRDEHFAKFIETKKINDTVIVQATLSSLAAETIAKQQAQADELLILEARKAAQIDFAGAFGNVLSSIGGLLEQGTAASKVAAIAEIGLGTATGFINGLDIAQKSAKATGPAAAFAFPIFYATQVAAILTAVGKAKTVLSQVKGGGGGSVSVSAPSIQTVQAPVLPQQTSTSLNASSIQAVGNAASGGVNRSFVLDADINNSADRAARLNRAARLG